MSIKEEIGEKLLDPKTIAFSWSEEEFPIRDLEMIERHCRQVYIDGDSRRVVIKDADQYLLEELENRGIRYEVIE